MMDAPQPSGKRKLLFTSIALACALVGLLLAASASIRLSRGEVMAGYGGLSLTISFLVALLLSGMVTGQIGLIRGEKPLLLPILALLSNGGIFVAVILHL